MTRAPWPLRLLLALSVLLLALAATAELLRHGSPTEETPTPEAPDRSTSSSSPATA